MIVSQEWLGIYRFLLSAQGTSCIKPRGSPGSSPLRSDGSRDDQAGEAAPVEQSSPEAKSLKTKGQGTVQLPPQWATTKAARRGPEGQIKNYSHNNLLKETGLKAAPTGRTTRAKGSPPKKAQRLKKKDAYSGLQTCSCWGGWWWWWWGCWWMRTRSANHKSMWQRNGIWSLSLEARVK